MRVTRLWQGFLTDFPAKTFRLFGIKTLFLISPLIKFRASVMASPLTLTALFP
jgi:hypothetical protein